MLELIYVSASKMPFGELALQELLLKARRNNAASNITGMLLYEAGSFVQVLEGEAAAVRSLYGRISRDARHDRVTVLLETFTENRKFSDWSMGFVSTERVRASSLPGFSSFLQHGDDLRTVSGSKARDVLHAFRGGRWRRFVDEPADSPRR